jgi:glycosyltransferase involved in cell wall biosynthesis
VQAVHSLSMANFGPGYPKHEDLVFRLVERWLAPMTTGYLVVGRDLAARFTALGVPEDKLHVVRSGVRIDHSEESADEVKRRLGARHDVSDDIPWVVYVGSLEERKRVRDLPRLIEDLVEGLPAHLFVVGEGPQADQVMEEASTRGVTGQITLTGYADDAIDYIRAAEVVVLLSTAEGLPQVLVQAGAVGTPFVAYFVDGLHELINLGASGSIVTAGDMPALVEAIRRHLTGVGGTQTLDLDSWSPAEIERRYRDFFFAIL